jgi:hypothetical protein
MQCIFIKENYGVVMLIIGRKKKLLLCVQYQVVEVLVILVKAVEAGWLFSFVSV